MRVYQCCYTNLLRYDGPYKVGGWTATAFSRDIPPEVLRDCEHFQRADTSDRATDEFGKALRLYELICQGDYAYVIRTRYGMRDHMGRGNNSFSHAYIFATDDGCLERPETLLCLGPGCFTQDAATGVEPEAESAELARAALSRLTEGVLREPPPGDNFDFPRALDSTGLSVRRELYKTLLQCVYAHMDAKHDSGRQPPPLYIQYGAPDMEPDRKERLLRELLCCILYGLPHWMRRELRASNWSDLDNTPKDLIFTTEDVTRLAGDGGYFVLETGARKVERRRMARLERCGYLPYAALQLDPERFPDFFAGLDRYARALGDTNATSEAIRKLVWQCYWNPDTFRFTERPNVEHLERKDLVSLLSDAAESGLYSMGLKEVMNAVQKRVEFDTLTESLRGNLTRWENEYRRRQGIPELVVEEPHSVAPSPPRDSAERDDVWENAEESLPPPRETVPIVPETTPVVPEAVRELVPVVPETPRVIPETARETVPVTPETPPVVPEAVRETVPVVPEAVREPVPAVPETARVIPETRATVATPELSDPLPVWHDPEAEPPRVSTTLLPVKNWDAVERDWRGQSEERRAAVLDWLSQLLDRAQNVPIAEGIFRKQMERQSPQGRDIYFLLMMDRKVSGKLNPQAVVRAYCHEELARTKSKADAVRWRTFADLCSICARMNAADLSERIAGEVEELYRREAVPGGQEDRAVMALRMYEELVSRLNPREFDARARDARKYYWDTTDGNWKYFSFRALPEYEAFDDGKRHIFPTLIRMADSFRPGKEKEFLKQVSRFFQTLDTPDYYTSENKLRITGLLYEELDRRFAGTLPDNYRGWMNLATLAEEKATIPAVQELYEAMRPFDGLKLTECYPRFVWKCKDAGDRKARVAAYPLVRDACFQWDARQPLPLDLWITVGMEALSFCEIGNCFAIFEKKPDAAVLRMDAAEAVRDSSLMTSPAVQGYAQAYIKHRGDARIRKAVLDWLDASSGGKKKFLGVF